MLWQTCFTRDEEERAWLLDMHERLVPRVRPAFALCMLICLPFAGPLALGLMALTGLGFELATGIVAKTRRFEPIVVAWVFGQACFAGVIVVDDLVGIGGLVLMLVPVIAASGGFPDRVVYGCTAYTAALMTGVGLLAARNEVVAEPLSLFLPLAVLIAAAMIATAVRRSSIENRNAAVIDPLTGMLNRSALRTRAAELHQLSARTGEPVGVAVVDLDHFKAVNDEHGHVTGDHVLTEVASRLTTELRGYDLVYRLGGEEFVVLLPGTAVGESLEVAERLHEAIRSQPIAGLPVTASVGVAASSEGSPFVFEPVFAAADAALYAAKAAGRDRVGHADPAPLG